MPETLPFFSRERFNEIVGSPYYMVLSGFTEGVSLGRTTPMRSEPNHIRH